jgi:hypothetical protein
MHVHMHAAEGACMGRPHHGAERSDNCMWRVLTGMPQPHSEEGTCSTVAPTAAVVRYLRGAAALGFGG